MSCTQWLNSNLESLPIGTRIINIFLLSLPYGKGKQTIMPLGLMAIASYVKEKLGAHVNCRVIDLSGVDPSDFSAIDKISEYLPDLIGMSVYSDNAKICINWAKVLREKIPGIVIFGGGPHISLAGRKFMEACAGCFDVVFQGEGEEPTLAILLAALKASTAQKSSIDYSKLPNAIYFDGIDICQGYPSSWQLDQREWANPLTVNVTTISGLELKFTDRKDGIIRRAVALTSSRGCPLKCSFCAIIAANNGEKSWRGLDSDTLIEWLEKAYKKTPFQHLYLMDANFFVKPSRALSFARMLSEAFNNKVTWSASATVGYLLRIKDMLPTLANQGLRLVELGIEAGSDSQLKLFNKNTTVANNIEAISLLRRNKIDLGFDFIMFHQLQTINDIQENLRFILRAGLVQHENLDFYFNSLILYPGTPLRSMVLSRNGIHVDENTIPEGRSLIIDAKTRWVYETFIDSFAKKFLSELVKLISTLQVMRRPAKSVEHSKIRLGIIHLRHLPFQVLWGLCEMSKKNKTDQAEVFVMKMTERIKTLSKLVNIEPRTTKENLALYSS